MTGVFGRALGLAACAALVGCGGDQATTAASGAASAPARNEVVAKTAVGDATVKDGVNQDVTLPQGMAKMPGATILHAATIDGGKGVGEQSRVEMSVPGAVAGATLFYKSELAKIGAAKLSDVSTSDNAVLMAKATNGDRLTISIRPGDTAGTAMVGITNATGSP